MKEQVVNSPNQQTPTNPVPSAEDCRPARRPLYSLVRITYCSELEGRSLVGRAIDVSDGGIAFEILTPLDVDQLILLEYTDTNDDCRYRRRKARLQYLAKRTFLATFADLSQGELPH